MDITFDMRRFRGLKGRTAPIMQEVEWVKNNLGEDIESIAPDDPPSRFSLELLAQAKANKEWFMQVFVPKLLPKDRQIDVAERQKDDGRILSQLDELEAEFYVTRAKELAGEPRLPPDAAGVGEVQ